VINAAYPRKKMILYMIGYLKSPFHNCIIGHRITVIIIKCR